MEEDRTDDEELSSPLKVGELLALLQHVDPDFVVVVGADARSLLIVNPKPGFCQPRKQGSDRIVPLTDQDREFLRALHIK